MSIASGDHQVSFILRWSTERDLARVNDLARQPAKRALGRALLTVVDKHRKWTLRHQCSDKPSDEKDPGAVVWQVDEPAKIIDRTAAVARPRPHTRLAKMNPISQR